MTSTSTASSATSAPGAEALDLTRHNVRDLLLRSDSFRALPQAKQQEIARHTVEIANYLAAPEGVPGNTLPTAGSLQGESQDPYAFAMNRPQSGRRQADFSAQGAREGAQVAGVLLQEVNFPEFVGGLITNVFQAIVTSSIEQMEAYGNLVANVAKTLNQFRDENISANQGRDYLVEQFPDTFELEVDTGGGDARPRVRLRDGVDESAAMEKIKDLPVDGEPIDSLDLEDEETEGKLVQAARTQLATSRQQLLATMVLMGINRIVVTDGKISAKVMYDFRARDTFKTSATAFDYENLGTRTDTEGEYESQREGSSWESSRDEEGKRSSEFRGANYYASGKYKTTTQPLVKIRSVEATAQDAELSTRAQLAGNVEVNFKSDYLPLEKMADSFQIGQIQQAADRKGAKAANGAATPA